MKKKLLWIIGILAALVLIATLIGPHIILNAVRQPAVADSYAYSESFYESYDEIRAHLQELTADLGVEIYFDGPASETEIAAQVDMVKKEMAKGPKALALAALDTSAVADILDECAEKNIPVIGFDSGVPGAPEGAILANAATNNYNAGAAAAENVYALISEKIAAAEGAVRIGVIAQDNVSESVTLRGLGFIDKMMLDKRGEVISRGVVKQIEYIEKKQIAGSKGGKAKKGGDDG